ncbi:Clp protease N-terminal domain-containing protein [Lentzea sp. JNUCC 0626]|uniref:Clp protease N-terminal domain-containing protein n=1 Tax=Lentzea sp. JNUCC 0626 TaxID=3367513 RepID=UPI003748C58F
MAVDQLTDQARGVLAAAQDEARLLGHDYVGTEHLLLGLIAEAGTVATALALWDLDIRRGRELVAQLIGRGRHRLRENLAFSPRAKRVIENHAPAEARATGRHHVGPEHLLLGILREGDGTAVQMLRGAGTDLDHLARAVVAPPPRIRPLTRLVDDLRLGKIMERAAPTRVRGRDPEIQRAAQVLARHNRMNPVLVGRPGIGRREVAEGLAWALIDGTVPPALRDRRIYDISGDTDAVVAQLRDNPRAIAWIGEIGKADEQLRQAIVDGQVQVVCTATPDSFAALDHALTRRLQPVRVEEMSVAAVAEVLDGVRDRMQDHHQLWITDEALAAVARFARTIDPFPATAIELLDEVCARGRSHAVAADETGEQADEVRRMKARTFAAHDMELYGNWRGIETELFLQRQTGRTPTTTAVTALLVRKVVDALTAESYFPEPAPDPFTRSGADLWMIS